MKIILSRKGFDAAAGGYPSPILPDGRMISLPIEAYDADKSTVSFEDINRNGINLGQLVADLCNKSGKKNVHFDPDLNKDDLKGGLFNRDEKWVPNLGHSGSAQKFLMNKGVGKGDLFLFFGWFREIVLVDQKWRYSADPQFTKLKGGAHVLFGWLQVGEVLPLEGHTSTDILRQHGWLSHHPHLQGQYLSKSAFSAGNALYLSAERILIPGEVLGNVPGAGFFLRFHPGLMLSAPNQVAGNHKRSLWELPASLFPKSTSKLNYVLHDRWKQNGETCLVDTKGRWQELVLEHESFPEAAAWAASIVSCGLGR